MNSDVTVIPGVGPASKQKLQRLGIVSVGDLLWHFPRTYLDRTIRPIAEMTPEHTWVTIAGRVVRIEKPNVRRRNLFMVRAIVDDDTGTVDLVWFYHGFRHSYRTTPPLRPGQHTIASGTLRSGRNGWELHNVLIGSPEECVNGHPPPWPVYALTQGISRRTLKRWIHWALDRAVPREWLAPAFSASHDLMDLTEAFKTLHRPTKRQHIEKARRRLVFEELYRFYTDVNERALNIPAAPSRRCDETVMTPNVFLNALPFVPTDSQKQAVRAVARDVTQEMLMKRVLIGDVGSGKTVVAAYAALHVVKSGFQAMVMAPTKILASQLHRSLAQLLRRWEVPIYLLTSSTPIQRREELIERIRRGMPLVAVGTQALLSEDVSFARLGLVIVDEEHRFGVQQRESIIEKIPAHFLAMSATPIPRTLAATFYVGLQTTFLAEKPPGRRRVDTRWIKPDRRDDVYAFVRREVELGNQAYIVFPRVDDDDDGSLKAIRTEAERLASKHLSGINTGIVHGRQTAREQEQNIMAFSEGATDVLLATTVVEVGVDVPNATVIVVENADQFGLAQLHQLRGRVGRGEKPSYCFLIADPQNEEAMARIQAIRRHDDGFKVAELDLRLRGPGDLGGLRQTGPWPFKLVDPLKDETLFALARHTADRASPSTPKSKPSE